MEPWWIICGVMPLIFLIIFILGIKKLKIDYRHLKDNLWQVLYSSFVFLSVFLLFCFYVDFFIMDFLNDLGLRFSIRDPQDYLNLKIDFIIYYTLFFTIFAVLFLVWIYLWSYFSFFFESLWLVSFVCFLLYYFGVDLIIRYDLFFSNWPDFKMLRQVVNVYNLTPDIFILILVYYSELYVLIDFILLFFLLIGLKKKVVTDSFFSLRELTKKLSKSYVHKKFKLKKLNLYRQIMCSLILIYLFFMFGGESLIREAALISFFCLFLEVIFFTFSFFYFLNFFKNIRE